MAVLDSVMVATALGYSSAESGGCSISADDPLSCSYSFRVFFTWV